MSSYNLLLEAATTGDLEAIRDTLDAGANINAFNHLGDNPLSKAIENSKTNAYILLCNRGANPSVNIRNVGTCLTLAALFGPDKTIVDILIQTKKVNFECPSHEFAFKIP